MIPLITRRSSALHLTPPMKYIAAQTPAKTVQSRHAIINIEVTAAAVTKNKEHREGRSKLRRFVRDHG